VCNVIIAARLQNGSESFLIIFFLAFVSVSTVREKDDGTDYQGRKGELIAFDQIHTPIDGEFFLQVSFLDFHHLNFFSL
jgi:hypothetical protein